MYLRLLALTLAGLTLGCGNDVTGPSSDAPQTPVSYRQKSTRGGGGSNVACTRPTSSWECFLLFGTTVGAAGAWAATCPSVFGCITGAGGVWGAGQTFINHPNCSNPWCQNPSYPTIGRTRPWNMPENGNDAAWGSPFAPDHTGMGSGHE